MDLQMVALLRIVGSPFTISHLEGAKYSQHLYSLAYANKIPLTYLNRLAPHEKVKITEYNYHYARFQRILDIIAEISELFAKSGINYVVFKTLRPYPDDTADIDVLTLGSPIEYAKMVKALQESGYKLLEVGPHTKTFRDHKTEIMIDIYNEISVSRLIYLDKREIRDYTKEAKLSNGGETRILAPEADLAVTIAHSVIKENTYILAEYYTTLHHLNAMNKQSIQELIHLVKKNHLKSAVRWHFTLTILFHKLAHGKTPKKLVETLSMLGGSWGPPYKGINSDIQSPYVCEFTTLMRVFSEKFFDKVFRRSMSSQALNVLSPTFMRRVLGRAELLWTH